MKHRALSVILGGAALVSTGWWLGPASASGSTCTAAADAERPAGGPPAAVVTADCTSHLAGHDQVAHLDVTYVHNDHQIRIDVNDRADVVPLPGNESDGHTFVAFPCPPPDERDVVAEIIEGPVCDNL